MRADLEQKPDEDNIVWLKRLHNLVAASGSITSADPEALQILIDNIPGLLDEIKGRRSDAHLTEREEFGGPRQEGM